VVEMEEKIKIRVDTSEIDVAQKKVDKLINSIKQLNELIEGQNKKPADNDKLDAEKIADSLEKRLLSQKWEQSNFTFY
jgi:hypothetical protein